MSTDQLLRTAVVSLLGQQAKKKKPRSSGLPFTAGASDSEEEETEADPLRRLSSAKGTMLAEKLKASMEADPKAYVHAIEVMASQLLGEPQPQGATIERYRAAPDGQRERDRLPGLGNRKGSQLPSGRGARQSPLGAPPVDCSRRTISLGQLLDCGMEVDSSCSTPILRLAGPRILLEPTANRSCAFQVGTSDLGCERDSPVEGRRGSHQASLQGRQQPSRQGARPRSGQHQAGVSSSPVEVKPAVWRHVPAFLYSLMRRERTQFSQFLRDAAAWGADVASAELLPCAIPYPWQTPKLGGSRRRNRRFVERRALDIAVNLQVCAINFCFLGMPPRCPPKGCRGSLTQEQNSMVMSLRERARSLSRLVGDLSSGCGSKVSSVQGELDSLETIVDSLRDLVYGSCKQSTSKGSGVRTEVVPTVASLVAFPQKLIDFDPKPFLSEPYLTAFTSPSKLLRPHVTTSPAAPIVSAQNELWHLFWRWDQAHRLCLALGDEIDTSHCSNLFCLSKPDGELRQIIDRRPRNSLELDPPKDAPKMGHASSFVDLVVPSKGCIRGSLDDLRNFYHAFRVSDERAFSTPVGPVWHLRDFKGSAALDALRLRRPGVKLTPNTRVHACFAGLSMGDKWAPSIAQISHENVLRQAGALRDEEHVCLGFPLPRAPLGHYSGVCIDDKVSLQVFPQFIPVGASEEHCPARDLEACRQSDRAYGKVGLETHPKKVVRRAGLGRSVYRGLFGQYGSN